MQAARQSAQIDSPIAIGEPDIGQLFPDDDPAHVGEDSAVFLSEAVKRAKACGYCLGNLDITIICERPKIGPRKDEMLARIAAILECDRGQVNLKGKTHEGVDAIGQGRAVEVHVVALLVSAATQAKDHS